MRMWKMKKQRLKIKINLLFFLWRLHSAFEKSFRKIFRKRRFQNTGRTLSCPPAAIRAHSSSDLAKLLANSKLTTSYLSNFRFPFDLIGLDGRTFCVNLSAGSNRWNCFDGASNFSQTSPASVPLFRLLYWPIVESGRLSRCKIVSRCKG